MAEYFDFEQPFLSVSCKSSIGLPQSVLAQEGVPFFGRDNQHNPNMTSKDASPYLTHKKG